MRHDMSALPIHSSSRLPQLPRPTPRDTRQAVAFARYAMTVQVRIITDNEPGVLLGQRIPLHDLRVALRRLRLLLRIFRPLWKTTPIRRLENDLGWLSHTLGSARDIDVWLHFLATSGPQARLSNIRFLNRQVLLKQQHQRRVLRLLTGERYRAIKASILRLILVDLPRLSQRLDDAPGLKKIARRSIRRILRRSLARYDEAYPDFASETTHRLRIACRKARYTCEFFADILGKTTERWGEHLKDLQNQLGHIHDMDVWDTLLSEQNIRPSHPLRSTFARLRRQAIKRFKKDWNDLDIERFADEI